MAEFVSRARELAKQIWWDDFFIVGSTEIAARIRPTEAAGISIVNGILSDAGMGELLTACRAAADRFDEYAAIHAAKPDPVKAARNKEMADEIRAAIAKATGSEAA